MMARFPLVTVEKFQGPCGWGKDPSPDCNEEGQIATVLKQVKQINPNVSTVFYLNAVYDFPWYVVLMMLMMLRMLMMRTV